MKGFILALVISVFAVSWAQDGADGPNPLQVVNVANVKEEKPGGDLIVTSEESNVGDNTLSSASYNSGQSGATGAKSLATGARHFWPPPVYPHPNPYDTCPVYRYEPKDPVCRAGHSCSKRRCKIKVKKGYYCGLEFYLYNPFWVAGSYCKSQSKCGLDYWRLCYCRTKFCWFKLKRVIKHYSKYYFVYAWMRHPCGCECRGKKKQKPYIPHPTIYHPPTPHTIYPDLPYYPDQPYYPDTDHPYPHGPIW
ncbi:uncharacterized protein LOC120334088 [Styela clava]